MSYIHHVIEENGFVALPIKVVHALEMENLPEIHRDPFDRMLISQARVEKATLITSDRAIQSYDVRTVW